MLRLLHTADVHLGARHTDLGERAAVLRERQFTAFRVTVDLAVVEAVDLVLIAGDLFDSNMQPRRSVERVAAELARLAKASIRTVIIPGTHDVYDGASIYRSYDLAAMARTSHEWIAVLTPEQPNIWLPSLDAVVHGRVFNTKRAPKSPLDGFDSRTDGRGTWRIGMVHGALAIPGKTEGDEVVFTEDEIAQTGLDYLALGHWHSAIEGRAGNVTYAYSGAPEPVAMDQDGAGQVLLVTLAERGGRHQVSIVPKRVGQTRSEKLDLDVSGIQSQPALIQTIASHADSNLFLDLRLTGLMPDTLDVDLDEVERALAPSFLRFRVRDLAIPALPDGPMPPPDTVLGAFVRNMQARIAEIEKAGSGGGAGPSGTALAADQPSGAAATDAGENAAPTVGAAPDPGEELADLREMLRLGRHLLEGREVTL
ncbi:MAG: DNA repair exonuclease [Candidatus Limnocylindrales bacterium]|jgi:DNA repair exonuclease SbcCD nuclease subunit